MIRKILVGVDGSAASRKAAEFARDLANQTGAALVVVIAIEPPEAAALGAFDAFAIRRVHPSPQQLQDADAIAHGLGMPSDRLTIRVEVGPPADTLRQVAEELAVDLVVVGARGVGRAEALVLGSVSEKISRDIRRPITVVH